MPVVTSEGKGFPNMWLKTSESGYLEGGGRIDATGHEVRKQAVIIDTGIAIAGAALVAAVIHVTVFRSGPGPDKKTPARKPAARPVKKPVARRK